MSNNWQICGTSPLFLSSYLELWSTEILLYRLSYWGTRLRTFTGSNHQKYKNIQSQLAQPQPKSKTFTYKKGVYIIITFYIYLYETYISKLKNKNDQAFSKRHNFKISRWYPSSDQGRKAGNANFCLLHIKSNLIICQNPQHSRWRLKLISIISDYEHRMF